MSFHSRLCFFFLHNTPKLELFIASLARGYKVSHAIEPGETDDCHFDRTFRLHEPLGWAKKHKQKRPAIRNQTSSPHFCSGGNLLNLLINWSQTEYHEDANIVYFSVIRGGFVWRLVFHTQQHKPLMNHPQFIFNSTSECSSSLSLRPVSKPFKEGRKSSPSDC